mmetsp:Transcript_27383/g.41452  ORF Transcript_27383/g.41452 Transcript_27383/m.41452 type:complete len:753 (+) Transcript_27383:44-2302(+)
MQSISLFPCIVIALFLPISGFVTPTTCRIIEQQHFAESSLASASTEGNLEKDARISQLELDLETEKKKVSNLQEDFETLLNLVKDAQQRETDLLENLSVLEADAQRDDNVVSEAQNCLDDARRQLSRAADRCSKAEEAQAKAIEIQKQRKAGVVAAKEEIKQHSLSMEFLKKQLESLQDTVKSLETNADGRSQQLVLEIELAKKAEEERREALKRKEAEEEQQRQKEESLQAKKAEEERLKLESLKQKELEEELKRQEEQKRQMEEAVREKEAEEERRRVQLLEKKKQEEEERKQQIEAMQAKKAEQERQKSEAMERRKQEEEERKRQKAEAEAERRRSNIASKAEAEDLPVINDWKITSAGEVMGLVSGHSAMEDGDLILTSRLASRQEVSENSVVATKSGSKYFLGKRDKNTDSSFRMSTASYARSLPIGGRNYNKDDPETKEALAFFTKELGLTGKKIAGAVKTYLLSGKPSTTSSGRSKLWTGYVEDKRSGLPTGDALAIKISSHREGMERDNRAYKKVTNGFLRKGEFCRQRDFVPSIEGNKNECALVMDLGKEDLREFIDRQNDGLAPRDLRDAASAAAQCLDAIHSAKLVWTDLKSENFVVFDTEDHIVVKGIDLESAMPFKSNPVDYSPEACPPEFATAYLSGEGSDFVLESSYDIWSFGMLLYELATGRGYFESKSGVKYQPTQIMKTLCTIEPDVSAVKDEKLRDLISQCLSVDPKKRPAISQVLLHSYFLTTGVGPFSFFL